MFPLIGVLTKVLLNMALVPIRNIGQHGVNTDWDPFDLPSSAWTMATNIKFMDGRIRRGPVFTTAGALAVNTSPSFAISVKLLNGTSQFLLCNQDGTINWWSASYPGAAPTEAPVSPSGYTPNPANLAFTGTVLNNVIYVNRSDRVPWSMTAGGAAFTTLPVWDSAWTCGAFRSIGGTCVAINVTKGGVSYPTMVKTSEYTVFGATPSQWVGATNNSATENVLSDCQDPLIDGWPLRENLILYSNNETWLMYATGDSQVWGYRRLFKGRGVVNQNCIADYDNRHYVFGYEDIWMHDGYNPKSLASGRVRDFIYNNIVRSQSYQSFVVNNFRQNEILFCYVSSDPYCHFPTGGPIGYPGCNRAASYNFKYDTWTFYDLPYLTGAALGIPFSGTTYDNLSVVTYNSLGGAYDSYFDATRFTLMTCGVGASGSFGIINPSAQTLGSAVHIYEASNIAVGAGVIDTVATAPCYLENKQLDMDEVAKEIRGYKVVNQMYPEAHFDPGAPPMTFYWGSTDYSNIPVVYGNSMTFDGSTFYKLDFNSPGRYLSIKMTYTGTQDFSWSGMDIDFQLFAHR